MDEDIDMREKKGKEKTLVKAQSHRRRNLLIGLAVAGLVPPLVIRAAAERLRRMPDPEADEVIGEPLDEKTGYLESFDGTRLFVEELGKGPTLVLAHGWFCNTDSWHYQKKWLSEKYRIICYDQRGHGRSPAELGADFSLEAFTRDLRCVLDNYAAGEPVVLAGHSMGGMAILKFVDMYPEELGKTVKGVALVDTSNVPLTSCLVGGPALRFMQKPVVEPLLRWIVDHEGFADRVKTTVVGTSPFLVATRYLGYGKGASLNQLEYIGEMARRSSMKGVCQAGLGLLEKPETISLDALARSGIPVLVWVGRQDKLTRPEISERMHAELPGSELYIIENAGHPSYMEEYRRFNSVFSDFAKKSFAGDRGDAQCSQP